MMGDKNTVILGEKRGCNMGTEIYYFSGTGNSLAVARDIAVRIGGRPIPIPSVID